jgi:hypothetical protein
MPAAKTNPAKTTIHRRKFIAIASKDRTENPTTAGNRAALRGVGGTDRSGGNKLRKNSRLNEKLRFGRGFVSGHDFSRAESTTKSCWALAPAVLFSVICNSAVAKAGIFFAVCGTTKVVPVIKQ